MFIDIKVYVEGRGVERDFWLDGLERWHLVVRYWEALWATGGLFRYLLLGSVSLEVETDHCCESGLGERTRALCVGRRGS